MTWLFSLLLVRPSEVQNSIFWQDLRDDTSSDRLASFSEGEARSLIDSEWEVQLCFNSQVVAWHSNLNVVWKSDFGSSVSRSQVQLRAISRTERILSSAFLSLQAIDVRLDD